MSLLLVTTIVVVVTFALVVALGYGLSQRAHRSEALANAAVPRAAAPLEMPAFVAPTNGFAELSAAAPHNAATPGTHVTWPSLIDEGIGDLPLAERRALIARLASVGDEWTLPILRRAIHEERDAALLDAAVDALIGRR